MNTESAHKQHFAGIHCNLPLFVAVDAKNCLPLCIFNTVCRIIVLDRSRTQSAMAVDVCA